MKCLKTGLYVAVDEQVFHCDLFGDLVKRQIIIRGFAKDPLL